MDINLNYTNQVNFWDLFTGEIRKTIKVQKDIIGQKYNQLTIISGITFKKGVSTKLKYHCFASCSCGSKIKSYIISDLKFGNTKSCGCHRLEVQRESGRKNGGGKKTHGLSCDKLYKTWKNMMYRCYNENASGYESCGGRGIEVIQEWHDASKFMDWAKDNGYNDDLYVGRFNVNKNFEPTNIRFGTRKEIDKNKSTVKRAKTKNSTSRFRGVSWDSLYKLWTASITCDGNRYFLGFFYKEHDAALAYNKKALELFKEHSCLNKIDEDE